LGVAGRVDHGLELQLERALRRLCNGEPLRRGDKVLGRQRFAVDEQ
jgi:hypothetical protein